MLCGEELESEHVKGLSGLSLSIRFSDIAIISAGYVIILFLTFFCTMTSTPGQQKLPLSLPSNFDMHW